MLNICEYSGGAKTCVWFWWSESTWSTRVFSLNMNKNKMSSGAWKSTSTGSLYIAGLDSCIHLYSFFNALKVKSRSFLAPKARTTSSHKTYLYTFWLCCRSCTRHDTDTPAILLQHRSHTAHVCHSSGYITLHPLSPTLVVYLKYKTNTVLLTNWKFRIISQFQGTLFGENEASKS